MTIDYSEGLSEKFQTHQTPESLQPSVDCHLNYSSSVISTSILQSNNECLNGGYLHNKLMLHHSFVVVHMVLSWRALRLIGMLVLAEKG